MKRIALVCCITGLFLTGLTAGSALGADAEKGKKLYESKRCGLCHLIQGQGGKKGPDLSTVGSKRDGDWLTKFLKEPKKVVPGAMMPPVKGTDEEIADLAAYMLSLKK
ncbi:MAG: cytochrome c [Nitrospirae bacterium]|nr:cytochrome c [Nitrospirota bacterium]